MFRYLFRLRFEELLALVFFLPMAYLTLRFAGEEGFTRGNLERFFVLLAIAFAFWAILRRHKYLLLVRDFVPIIVCLVIYLNLHDLIHFVNRSDKDAFLAKVDFALFGIQPTLFLETMIHPWITDYTTFCYSLFYFVAPALGVVLYFSREFARFRRFAVSVLMCFYIGYFGYILVPAVGPRFFLAEEFTRDLSGSEYSQQLRDTLNVLQSTRRDCFPSLHNGVTMLTLLFCIAWRRRLLIFFAPIAFGIMYATIYLRYHWVIDQLAGWLLAFFCFWLGPKVSDFWDRKMAEADPEFSPLGVSRKP